MKINSQRISIIIPCRNEEKYIGKVLDDIVEGIIEKNLSFEQLVEAGYDPATVKDVFRRIVINEYKRRQASPGIKVTSKAFGYGRRFPIARGGEYF